MKNLIGSEKQISWAEAIRSTKIKECQGRIEVFSKFQTEKHAVKMYEKMLDFLTNEENASTIIDIKTKGWESVGISPLVEDYM